MSRLRAALLDSKLVQSHPGQAHTYQSDRRHSLAFNLDTLLLLKDGLTK